MPVNLAEKWGLLPMNHYPELAGHKPADWDDFDSWPLKDDPEWAEVWRRNRSGNPLPIYEDFSPSSDFEGWEELEPQDNGLRTPDSTQSTPQVPLPSFVLRTPSPVRNGLPSPPPGDDIIFPQPARLESPETFLRAIRDKVKYPRRPVTRSTNSAGRYCSLSYKPGKIACLQDSDGIKESTYAELNSAASEHDKHASLVASNKRMFRTWEREDKEKEREQRKERRAADKAKQGTPSRPVAGSGVQKRSAHKPSRGGRRTRGGLRGK